MPDSSTSRREFLSTSGRFAGSGWLLLNLPVVASLAACAREAAQTGEATTTLSASEAAAARAFAARILPSEPGEPGAEEAGAVYFIDGMLAGPFAAMLPLIQDGLADLDARAEERGGATFSALGAAEQEEVMRDVEQTPFFFNARMLTLMGVFSDPSYGGNRDGVGDRLYGLEHSSAWQPPFGYYDAEAAGNSGGAA